MSHSSQDNTFTERLVNDLRESGVDVWVDAQGINEGDIAQRINEAFIGRQWLILVMTAASLRSPWVQAEVNASLIRINQGKMSGFIPVIAGPIHEEEIPALW
ncbi:MAG TPA: toll/interleukin-1 receptor domain-containing protein, partial [Ktedonobacterales bacterium]